MDDKDAKENKSWYDVDVDSGCATEVKWWSMLIAGVEQDGERDRDAERCAFDSEGASESDADMAMGAAYI